MSVLTDYFLQSSKEIKDAWEKTKSTRHNLGDMGLAYDANEALKIPGVEREFRHDDCEAEDEKKSASVPPKISVAATLEAEANAPRERMFRLPNQQVQFLTYLMDKYGEDYKAMARDKKNHYQLTWRQIRAKINTFKGIPEQYAEYLLKKGDIVLDNPETLEQTRKRIAEENVKKFCAPKPKKAKPVETGGWLEESLDDIDFDTGDKLEDVTDVRSKKTEKAEKKLQLFPDDESDDREGNRSKTKLMKTKKENKVFNPITNLAEKGKAETNGEIKQKKCKPDRKNKVNTLEKSCSSDSDSEEEFEGDDDDAAGFVDLKDLSDEELSEDDILDNGEFVTDSDEDSD